MQSKIKVRLSDHDLEMLSSLFRKHFLPEDKLWLFGSRVDLSKKGGDIDLYIETQSASINDAVKMRSNFIWNLEEAIGEQKIDVVLNMLNFPHQIAIHDIAKITGVRII